MLISMNWISEFTDLEGVDKKDLIDRFTLSTAEVEDIFEMGKDIRDVVVGRITEVNEHPNSQKLHLVKVDIGSELVEVVCGAPNVSIGALVPFAKLGGRVGDLEIKEVPIAGVVSSGMCCSEKELGISDDNSGLMIFEEDYPLGTDIKEFMELEDTVFEVDNKSLTNRPDLWGHYGIAREIAALNKRPLKPLELVDTDLYKSLKPIDLKVLDNQRTYRFSCITMDNIRKKKSPINMRIRLTYCGMRPINLLADLTNYLMMEIGQPMHAYDNRKVKDIRVKTFSEPFEFLTLDGVRRKIDSDTLMICDSKEPIGIAGVMGGELSSIDDDTSSVLLESANFDGTSVRKSATKLGLRTDASSRYEKTLDPEMTVQAIARFMKLLMEIDPGVNITSSLTDSYVQHYDCINVDFDKAFIDKYTGIDISSEMMEDTLSALGFDVHRSGDKFSVEVPSWRATKDVSMKADIVEEITRIYGYDNFDIYSTKSLLSPIRHSVERDNEYRIKILLSDKYDMNEVHSYIWYETKMNKELGIHVEPNIRVVNSVTAENDIIRSTIIPSLLAFVYKNADTNPEMGMYEIGRVVDGLTKDGLCNEKKRLGIVVASKILSEKEVFFKLKEAIEQVVLDIKNIAPAFVENNDINKYNYVHPINSAGLQIKNQDIGYFSVLNPKTRNNIDKKLNVAFAEIDIDDMEKIDVVPLDYKEVSKYPGVTVDLSLLVDKKIPYEALSKYIDMYPCQYLAKYYFVDIFEDDKLLKDKKSVTVRFEFISMERTLESHEIQNMVDGLLAVLKSKNIELR